MGSTSFNRRKRARLQRIKGNNGFVPVSIASAERERLENDIKEKLLEAEREKLAEERRKKREEQRQREEDEAKIQKMYEEAMVNDELEWMRIPLDFILSRKKDIHEVLQYKKGSEATLKGKARYVGDSKSSLQRKKLPTAKQNGSTLELFGFTKEKKADYDLKRKRDEEEETDVGEQEVAANGTTTEKQPEAMEDQLSSEINFDDLEEMDASESCINYEEEEDLEDLEDENTTTEKAKYVENLTEMEALIPLLEQKYQCLKVSDDDQQQTDRAYFDLRKYNTFRYASLIAYFKKRCFDKKKKVTSTAIDPV